MPKPALLAVFLLLGLILRGSGGVEGLYSKIAAGGGTSSEGVWGGPAYQGSVFLLAAAAASGKSIGVAERLESFLPATELRGAVYSSGSPFGASGKRGPIIYKVAKGDTLSAIAARFGVSVKSLLAVNPGVKTSSLRAGQELVILPVAGILYQARAGDSLDSIAARFQITPAQLAEFNPAAAAGVVPGSSLVIPGIYIPPSSLNPPSFASSVSAAGYFAKPVEGWTSGALHTRNGVDIVNACGTPVVAAAEGLVLDVARSGWNGGYGLYVYLEHPNGARTKYAHLEKVGVEIGDYLKRGDKIGTVGKSGEATGCHLHFEVEGAANPFAKQLLAD